MGTSGTISHPCLHTLDSQPTSSLLGQRILEFAACPPRSHERNKALTHGTPWRPMAPILSMNFNETTSFSCIVPLGTTTPSPTTSRLAKSSKQQLHHQQHRNNQTLGAAKLTSCLLARHTELLQSCSNTHDPSLYFPAAAGTLQRTQP